MQPWKCLVFIVIVSCILFGFKVLMDDNGTPVQVYNELPWMTEVGDKNQVQRREKLKEEKQQPDENGGPRGTGFQPGSGHLYSVSDEETYDGPSGEMPPEPDAGSDSGYANSRTLILEEFLPQYPHGEPPLPGMDQEQASDRFKSEQAANFHERNDTEWPQDYVKRNYRNIPEELYKLAPKIFDGVPPQFLPEYTNPCWWAPPSTERGAKAAARSSRTLRCLPYFFLAGMPKSGTTDVHDKLLQHPQIMKTSVKEPHWWTRHRFHGQSLEHYLDKQSVHIAPWLQTGSDPTVVIGDSSASTFWDNANWRQFFPGLDVGPPHLLNEVIHTVLPDAKFIVIFRNPIDRLYSDFNYFGSFNYRLAPSIFHDHVVQFLGDFLSCQEKTLDFRTCAYDFQDVKTMETSVSKFHTLAIQRMCIGMYSVYVRDWLEVFPRDQIKVLRLEDWHVNCTEILPGLYDFLELRKLDGADIEKICNKRSLNVNKRPSLPMLPETRQLLSAFYQPLNRELAELLEDDKYRWDDEKLHQVSSGSRQPYTVQTLGKSG